VLGNQDLDQDPEGSLLRRRARDAQARASEPLDGLEEPVVPAPDDEVPGGAVPEPADEHGRHQVEVGPALSPPVAPERDVDVVPDEAREGDVPAPPEVAGAPGEVWPAEVFGKVEPDQRGRSQGDVDVPREVAVDLDPEEEGS